MGEHLLENTLNSFIILDAKEVVALKEKLIEYCKIYYSNLPIFQSENSIYLDHALDWAVKRVEQTLNPRISSNGTLVIGDGTWIANANNYYTVLVQSKPDISFYLNEYLNNSFEKDNGKSR